MNGSGPRFPLFVDLRGRKILVVGAGAIAARRAGVLAGFGPDITVIAPEVCGEIEQLSESGKAEILKRSYREGDADGFCMVLALTDDPALNDKISDECRSKGIPVNNCSDRSRCDFYFPGIVREDDVVIGVNAGGEAHRKAAEITGRIRDAVKGTVADG